MPLKADQLAEHGTWYLSNLEESYKRAAAEARSEARANLSRAVSYEDDLAEIRKAIDLRENATRPIAADQRSALFAAFGEVFGHVDDAARYAFTRLVLGKPSSATVSWSSNKIGALTRAEASRVLDALDVLNV